MIAGETRATDELKIGSERSFGLVMAGVLVALTALAVFKGWALWLPATFLSLALALATLALIAPAGLANLNRAWMRLGLILGRIINPVVLGVIYVLSILPVGLAMRVVRHDPLRRRRDETATSYWVERGAQSGKEATTAGFHEQF